MSELEVEKKKLITKIRDKQKALQDLQLELASLERLRSISMQDLQNGAIDTFGYRKETKTFRNNMYGFNQHETKATYDKEIIIVSTNGYYLDKECQEAVDLYAKAKHGLKLDVYFEYE